MSILPERKLTDEDWAAIKAFFDDWLSGHCPLCHEVVQKEQQVGRCVVAQPCGHRLYQGRVKTEE
jgi:hypothetical protein